MPRTSFVHDIDGYAFLNLWEMRPGDWSQLLDVMRAALGAVPRLLSFGTLGELPVPRGRLDAWLTERVLSRFDPGPVGLCGGMTLGAADCFRRSVLPPRGAFPEGPRNPGWAGAEERALRELLWRRLMDSLRDGVAAETLLTMAVALSLGAPGRAWARERSRAAFQDIRRRIDANEVCPLAILGTTPNPMANHQVLVTGYESPGPWGAESCRLYVFEPNAPSCEQTIDYDFSGAREPQESAHAAGYHKARGPLVGFFLAKFDYQAPLGALSTLEPLRVESARVRVVVRNTGFGDTPPLRLWVRGKAGSLPADPGGESFAFPLRQGMGRGLDLPLPSPAPERLELAFAVEPAPGRRTWRLLS